MLSRWLAYITSWFARVDKFDEFNPRERTIYRYFDGKSVVAIDPMTISKRIAAVFTDLSVAMKVAGSPHSDATKMDDKALSIIRGIFNVKPHDEGGLLQDETYDLLLHFWSFEGEVKKNSKTRQTSVVETSPTTASTPAANQPTSPTLDSGSAESVSSIEPPPPLRTEQLSPSVPISQDSNTTAT